MDQLVMACGQPEDHASGEFDEKGGLDFLLYPS
jgi:hypothetical protein